MAYEKKISRKHPALLSMILDDSGSMADNLEGTSDPKYLWVERHSGNIFHDLLKNSSDMNGDTVIVKPRYYVQVIQYGSHPKIWGEPCMDIQTAVEKYTQEGNSLGLGGLLGGTDAEAAFQMTYDFLVKAIAEERFKDSFPPMVFHLTDGMSATDASEIAEKLKQLATTDGNVLVVNGYIGTQTYLNYKGPEDFPGYCSVEEAGPSEDNTRLFHMSSEMPETIRQNLIEDDIFPQIRKGSRLFFDVRTREMLKHVIQVVGSVGSRQDRLER